MCVRHARLYKRVCMRVRVRMGERESALLVSMCLSLTGLFCPVLCFLSLCVRVCVCLAIGAHRRRSPNVVASEIFEPHLGSHILQVGPPKGSLCLHTPGWMCFRINSHTHTPPDVFNRGLVFVSKERCQELLD